MLIQATQIGTVPSSLNDEVSLARVTRGPALSSPGLQVFIWGPSPHWMLVTSRGALRLHPMTIDGSIESFSPFHNINCPKGFLYFNKQVSTRAHAHTEVRRHLPLHCTK